MKRAVREEALMVAADVHQMYGPQDRPFYYALDDEHRIVPAKDASVLEDMEHRRVALTSLWRWHVSTVFLGIDHNFGWDGPPVLFETMVFGEDGASDLYSTRACTWREALREHDHACSIIRETMAARGDVLEALGGGAAAP